MKKRVTTILLILVFLAGLSLLLYPAVSDYINEKHSSKVIADYAHSVSDIDDQRYAQIWNEAKTFNDALASGEQNYLLTREQRLRYTKLLNIDGSGVMGYIEIPKISCTLPIYHGTSDTVLQIAAGHLEWTSLPTGGESTHCVLSGHRGLPSAELFSDLDKLTTGDVFELRVLDEVLTYEVDQILIVEPAETDELRIVKGMDYCTLVTCTPYGVNSHRLLVRGHRIANLESGSTVRITADALQIDPITVSVLLTVLLILLTLPWLLLPRRKNRERKES